MNNKRRKALPEPVVGVTAGPDRKGRFWVELPSVLRKLFFYSGLAGETVKVRRGRRGKKGEQGDLLEVIASHPARREVRCRHYGVCGGCTLQQLPEELALQAKTEAVYKLLKQVAPEAQSYPPLSSAQDFFYRTKVEMSFLREADGVTRLGFHRRGRFDKVVEIERCWLTPLSPSVIEFVRSWCKKYGLVGWDNRQRQGDLRFLLYRSSSSMPEDLLALVVSSSTSITKDMRADLVEGLRLREVRGALIIRQSSPAGAIVAESEEPLFGPQTITERLGSLEFELGWRSFYQTNPPTYLKMLDTMRRWRLAPEGSRLLDLFCGVGSIGLYLARPQDRLKGVELVEQAVLEARLSAKRNGIEASFEAIAAESLPSIETDLLLLDPPRSGCHPKLLQELSQQPSVGELFYISCNPYRVLEELPLLSQAFNLIAYQAFDFFPQTHHLELLLHFTRR